MLTTKKGKKGKAKAKIELNEKLVADVVDNKLVKFAFMAIVVLLLKIIIIQLIGVSKKLKAMDEELFLYDELDFEDIEDLYEDDLI